MSFVVPLAGGYLVGRLLAIAQTGPVAFPFAFALATLPFAILWRRHRTGESYARIATSVLLYASVLTAGVGGLAFAAAVLLDGPGGVDVNPWAAGEWHAQRIWLVAAAACAFASARRPSLPPDPADVAAAAEGRAREMGTVPRPAEYAYFLSYRGSDSHTARALADRLIASGISVWFAEYEIPLHARRPGFDPGRAIRDGIARSRGGLLITNERYVESAWCQLELQCLLEKPGAAALIEIRAPRESSVRLTGQAPGRRIGGDDVDEICRDLEPFLPNTLVADASCPAGRLLEWSSGGLRYAIDMAGWRRQRPIVRLVNGPSLRFAANPRLAVNVEVGSETAVEARRAQADLDNREMFDLLVEHAKRHTARLGAQPAGVHVLFHEGRGQFGVTYWNRFFWTRKTSIVMTHPGSRQAHEFVFTFGYPGSFEAYCRHARAMDRLALSLRWI